MAIVIEPGWMNFCSSDSNHLSKFTVLVVVAFIKKRRKKNTKTASKANTQPSSKFWEFLRESNLFFYDSCKC